MAVVVVAAAGKADIVRSTICEERHSEKNHLLTQSPIRSSMQTATTGVTASTRLRDLKPKSEMPSSSLLTILYVAFHFISNST